MRDGREIPFEEFNNEFKERVDFFREELHRNFSDWKINEKYQTGKLSVDQKKFIRAFDFAICPIRITASGGSLEVIIVYRGGTLQYKKVEPDYVVQYVIKKKKYTKRNWLLGYTAKRGYIKGAHKEIIDQYLKDSYDLVLAMEKESAKHVSNLWEMEEDLIDNSCMVHLLNSPFNMRWMLCGENFMREDVFINTLKGSDFEKVKFHVLIISYMMFCQMNSILTKYGLMPLVALNIVTKSTGVVCEYLKFFANSINIACETNENLFFIEQVDEILYKYENGFDLALIIENNSNYGLNRCRFIDILNGLNVKTYKKCQLTTSPIFVSNTSIEQDRFFNYNISDMEFDENDVIFQLEESILLKTNVGDMFEMIKESLNESLNEYEHPDFVDDILGYKISLDTGRPKQKSKNLLAACLMYMRDSYMKVCMDNEEYTEQEKQKFNEESKKALCEIFNPAPNHGTESIIEYSLEDDERIYQALKKTWEYHIENGSFNYDYDQYKSDEEVLGFLDHKEKHILFFPERLPEYWGKKTTLSKYIKSGGRYAGFFHKNSNSDKVRITKRSERAFAIKIRYLQHEFGGRRAD